jgi:tetratricopeptide (TPR) repeat protein
VLKRIKIVGAVLMSVDGICITGELGIEKDIDVVSAMFNVVSQFVEDTFESPADQIKLGDLFLTRVAGKVVILWVTSTGTSEALVNGIKKVLKRVESDYGKLLKDWDGLENKDLNRDFPDYLEDLGNLASEEESVDVPELGFDLLKRDDVDRCVDSLEDAYNLYFVSGDLDSAFDLAEQAAHALEKQKPNTRDSSLFHALAAKVMVLKRDDPSVCLKLLEEARDKSRMQENIIASAETADAYAHFYSLTEDHKQSREYSREALELIDTVVDPSHPRNLSRRVNFALTDIITYVYEDRYDLAIEGWIKLDEALEKVFDQGRRRSDVDRLMMARRKISINNNIGFVTTLKDRNDPDNYKAAIPHFEKALEAVEENNARWYYPIIKGNLGIAYAFLGEFEKAEGHISDGYRVALELKSDYRLAVAERDWGVFYYQRGSQTGNTNDLYEAMHWFNKALEKQTSSGEIEYIKFFQAECEKAIRVMLGKRIR